MPLASLQQACAHVPSLARPAARRARTATTVHAAKGPGKRSGGAKKGGVPPGQSQSTRSPPPPPPPPLQASAASQMQGAGGSGAPQTAQVRRTPPARWSPLSCLDAQASVPPLPPGAAPRNDVVSAALSTSLGLTVIGAGFRNFASSAASHGWPVPDLAARMPLPGIALDGAALQLPTPELSHVGYALAVAAGVTAARSAALVLWPAFREESERANKQVRACACTPALCAHRRKSALPQVLPSLSTADTLLISVATGASEARSAVSTQLGITAHTASFAAGILVSVHPVARRGC